MDKLHDKARRAIESGEEKFYARFEEACVLIKSGKENMCERRTGPINCLSATTNNISSDGFARRLREARRRGNRERPRSSARPTLGRDDHERPLPTMQRIVARVGLRLRPPCPTPPTAWPGPRRHLKSRVPPGAENPYHSSLAPNRDYRFTRPDIKEDRSAVAPTIRRAPPGHRASAPGRISCPLQRHAGAHCRSPQVSFS